MQCLFAPHYCYNIILFLRGVSSFSSVEYDFQYALDDDAICVHHAHNEQHKDATAFGILSNAFLVRLTENKLQQSVMSRSYTLIHCAWYHLAIAWCVSHEYFICEQLWYSDRTLLFVNISLFFSSEP